MDALIRGTAMSEAPSGGQGVDSVSSISRLRLQQPQLSAQKRALPGGCAVQKAAPLKRARWPNDTFGKNSSWAGHGHRADNNWVGSRWGSSCGDGVRAGACEDWAGSKGSGASWVAGDFGGGDDSSLVGNIKGAGRGGCSGGYRVVCTYFMQGRCRYGDACANLHPKDVFAGGSHGGMHATAIADGRVGSVVSEVTAPAEKATTPFACGVSAKSRLGWRSTSIPGSATSSAQTSTGTRGVELMGRSACDPPYEARHTSADQTRAAPSTAGSDAAAAAPSQAQAAFGELYDREGNEPWVEDGDTGWGHEWTGAANEGDADSQADKLDAGGEVRPAHAAITDKCEAVGNALGNVADVTATRAARCARADAFVAPGPDSGSAAIAATPAGVPRPVNNLIASAAPTPSASTARLAVSGPKAGTALDGDRVVDMGRTVLRRPSRAASGAANTPTVQIILAGSRETCLMRMRRFDREHPPRSIASSPAGAIAIVIAALRAQPWYAPPPYTWSVLEFGISTDLGAAGRNFADGGGWGRCEAMCPAAEAYERLHIAPNVNSHEQPIDGAAEQPAAFLVTMFHRNDAARVWQPSDIRTVSALAAAVEHMVTAVLDRPVDLPFIHRASFIRDRLRQVRQELTMQADSFSLAARLCAVDLLEVCTRFHITVEHKCCELGLRNLPPDEAKFDSKMNMQMYTQSLSGLMGIYEVFPLLLPR